MQLRDFWHFREGEDGVEQESAIDAAGRPQGPAIDYGVDGAGQLLVCGENRWIMGGYH